SYCGMAVGSSCGRRGMIVGESTSRPVMRTGFESSLANALMSLKCAVDQRMWCQPAPTSTTDASRQTAEVVNAPRRQQRHQPQSEVVHKINQSDNVVSKYEAVRIPPAAATATGTAGARRFRRTNGGAGDGAAGLAIAIAIRGTTDMQPPG